MMHFKPLILVLLATVVQGCTSKKRTDKKVDSQINQILEKKNYFKLKDAVELNEDKLTEDRLLYYNVFIAKAFGKHDLSTQYIDDLLKNHRQTLNDTMVVKLLDIKASNKIYNYQYKEASDIYTDILNNHHKVLDSSDIANYKNIQVLFSSIAPVKPQVVHKNKDVNISANRNGFNHLMTPVKSNTVVDSFIFDTGANFSTICESQARKMNLKIINTKIDVGSSTKTNVESKLAIAESLYIGDILFENIVFLVLPDSQLTFTQINYRIKGIIGFPVIHQLGEVHLHKNGMITVPIKHKDQKLANMFFEGLNPVVKVFSGIDTLFFTFDTGAKGSELSIKYYKEHEKSIKSKGEFQTNQNGGVGGLNAVNEYMLKDFPMTIGSKSLTLSKIPVTLEEYGFNKYFDGNLGQDAIKQFNKLIINFERMYIDFE